MIQMDWEETYHLWKSGSLHFPKALTAPVSAETIFVKYDRNGYYIYGYDWMEAEAALERKRLIQEDPMHFFCFTEVTKGTIQTAEMLVEARDEEERAAIWIAATAKELEARCQGAAGRYADALYMSATAFLKERYYLWHHAMRKLVPNLMIPYSVWESIVCRDAAPIMGLIQMNTLLLNSTWRILRYTSLENGKPENSGYRINHE